MGNERYRDLLKRTCEAAIAYLDVLGDRPVGRPADYPALLRSMGGDLPEERKMRFESSSSSRRLRTRAW